MSRLLFILSLTFIIFSRGINGQAKFTTGVGLATQPEEFEYLEQSDTRRVISLSGEWKVRYADEPTGTAVNVTVPSSFESDDELIFERNLPFAPAAGKNYKITFLGVSNKAEVSLNGRLIFRHNGGAYPFSFVLPRDLLKTNGQNLLAVKINGELDRKETIPFKMSFLYPYNNKGIFREVFVTELPNIYIGEYGVNYTVSPNGNRVELSLISLISNRKYSAQGDSLGNKYELSASVRSRGSDEERGTSANHKFSLEKGKDQEVVLSLSLNDPNLWSPDSPFLYDITFSLYAGDNLVDRVTVPAGFFLFRPGNNSFNLNNRNFSLHGVTYIPSIGERGSMLSYEEMVRDIRTIKAAGFNAVRFEKNIPHPYLLHLCAEEGLLVFMELPVSNLSSSYADDPTLKNNLINFSKQYLKGFSNFSTIAAFGLGSGYLGNKANIRQLLKDLSTEVKKGSSKSIYASFALIPGKPIEGIDIYGMEFVNRSAAEVLKIYGDAATKLGAGRVLITGAGFIVDPDEANSGNKHSEEAQAKFFEDLLLYSNDNPGFSYFFTTMFDYSSNYKSIISGAIEGDVLNFGLISQDRKTQRLSFKVADAMLNGREKVTISLGFDEDDAPIILIVFGLVLALLSAMFLNTGKKFKEDAIRAMLRPYNFFQDVRDYNQMSLLLTTYIGFLISAVIALITTSLLFYWRYDIVPERILLSFGFRWVLAIVSYLSWHPTQSLLFLTIFYYLLSVLVSLFVRIGAMFVINKVTFAKSYIIVVWASIPYIIALPGAILLYRMLNADIANLVIYAVLLLILLWNLHRLLKGMYVVYDVPALKVYFFTGLVVIGFLAGYLFYHQFTHFTIEQIVQVYLESTTG
ncbi:MAG: hypothetical protein LC102_04500 [Ignavibacteriales bacterium]|nr:hypothetical protein [Ignavibacteria bacterium]MBZ0196619.1 hypothetical protein [Ignavibacteriaceae bacterium]MCZ2142670.1 hypothetical protein [Ignavibacteriales bacterium]WKZ71565.1 MAG: glycoside hydrolase family 2 TIM barrel-domain containing protein [Ignavibacteriaceae bacterium]